MCKKCTHRANRCGPNTGQQWQLRTGCEKIKRKSSEAASKPPSSLAQEIRAGPLQGSTAGSAATPSEELSEVLADSQGIWQQ